MLPALPNEQSVTLANVSTYGAELVAWAEQADDIAAVREAAAKWGAITEYVRRTSRDGVVEAEAALRRLEVRVGQLLGPATPGSHHSVATEGATDIDRQARHDFRLLADHPDIVEAVIAESSDANPPSRRKVIKAIKRHIAATPEVVDLPVDHHARPTPDLFPTIVIDPPWRYDNVATRGAAEDHYPTMSHGDLLDLNIPAADNCHLYLWVTNSFFEDGFDLMRAWGFTYKTCLTWCKPQIGMGNYFRSTTEHVLFGIKGRQPTLRNDVPTHFVADRTRHSAKPESFYDLVEACSPGPWLEMFARKHRLGDWHMRGNQTSGETWGQAS